MEAAISRDVKDWGEYARPTQQDLMVIRMFTVWPGAISAFVSTYHRRYLSSAPLSEEDQLAMTAEVIGEETWDALSATEKKQAVERKVYVSKNLVAWQKSRQEAYVNHARAIFRGLYLCSIVVIFHID